VVSLFIAEREWIAWAPEGYYAASPGGERLMGWQVNKGPDQSAIYHPAIQFRPSLYQPDVIKNLFRTAGNLPQALAMAGKDRNRPVAAVNLTQVLPPAVAIATPSPLGGEFRLDREAVEVKAVAASTGGHPVRAMRLLVDGRPHEGDKGVRAFEDPKPGRVEANWQVKLTPGRHTLQVQAESSVSKGLSRPVNVMQAAGQQELPNLFVLAVGVNDYPGPMKLNFAATDAQAIAGVLQEKTRGIFGKAEVRLVTDKQATKAGVLDGLDWLGENMKAKDVGIFFFSGHGAKERDESFYLVPVDVQSKNVSGSCVAGELVKERLTNMPGRLVAVLDACHSGSAAESFRRGRPDDLVRDLVTDECGVMVLCSSLGEEVSLESTETRGGFFTHGLVEGLRGRADLNRDGVVYVHEANFYAALKVRQLSRGGQNPILGRSPAIRPFALTKP
jgi:hypothetical protein